MARHRVIPRMLFNATDRNLEVSGVSYSLLFPELTRLRPPL
jgi:hypothetical protein